MSQLLVYGYTRELQSLCVNSQVIASKINELCFAYYCNSIQYPTYNKKTTPSTKPLPQNNKLPKINIPNELLQKINISDHIMMDKINKKFNNSISDFYPDDIIRFVQGYAHEKERDAVTFEKVNDLIETGNKFNFRNILARNVMSTSIENECLRVWPLFIYGYDKQGHPIMYDEVCNSKPKDLEKAFKLNDQFKKLKTYRFRFLKRLHNVKRIQTMRYGYDGSVNNKGGVNMISKHVLVMDIGQFSIWNATKFKALMQDLIGTESNLWPNSLDKMYIINAPWLFSKGWAWIKPWVHPITQQKIEVIGSGYINKMKERINLDQIPKKYGGTCKLPIKYGYAADIENDLVDGDYSLQSDPIDLKTIECIKNKNH